MDHAAIPQFHEELRECRLCLESGYQIAPGPVFSSGPEPQVMLIGQAPGITEGQVKRPFNAGSGRRLFQWLGEAGWEETAFRARHYMTAVTKCYPGPGGNGKGDRVPSRAEQALCRPWLNRELALVNPRLLILVGGLAIKLLYPAHVKLEEIVGTAACFPLVVAELPINAGLTQAQVITTETAIEATSGGRFVVPLPHPSGASLWPNKPENRLLIGRAITLLSAIRRTYDL